MQDRTKNYLHYAKELLNLALPMILGSLGIILIGAGDVYIAAKHSTESLASISIANSLTSVVFMFGMGLLVSVSPILSNVRGQKKSAKKYFYPTLRFAFASSFLTTLAIIGLLPFVDYCGFEAKLIPDIKEYIFIISFSTFGGFLHFALKEFLQTYEIVFFPNLVTVVSIFVNLVLNWIFVFGWGILPPMGVKGLAIASVLVRLFMGLSVLFFCLYKFSFKNYQPKKYYANIVKIGLPISFAVSIEFLAINGMTLLLGRVAGLYAAAQNIVIIIISTAYMVPLAISNAIAIKVGFANGAKNILDIKKYAFSGVAVCTVFMAICGAFCAIFPRQLVSLFTQDVELIKIIVPVMMLVGCFQVFDGLQVALGGIAKGIKKTKFIFLSNLVGYWLVGFPVGAYFSFHLGQYLFGFWIGFILAPIMIAITLICVLIYEYKKLTKLQAKGL